MASKTKNKKSNLGCHSKNCVPVFDFFHLLLQVDKRNNPRKYENNEKVLTNDDVSNVDIC